MAVSKNFVVKKGLSVADSAVIGGVLKAAGLTYPSADGAANTVIKTNGSGQLSLGTLKVENLADIDLAALANGGLLAYDSATSKWVSGNELTEEKQNITSDGGFY